MNPRPTWYRCHCKLRVNANRTTDGRPYVVPLPLQIVCQCKLDDRWSPLRDTVTKRNAHYCVVTRTTDGRPYVVPLPLQIVCQCKLDDRWSPLRDTITKRNAYYCVVTWATIGRPYVVRLQNVMRIIALLCGRPMVAPTSYVDTDFVHRFN